MTKPITKLPMRQLYIGRWIKGFKKFHDLGQKFKLSPEAQYRLLVIAYYFNKAEKNACKTARFFGIHRNTVGKWLKLYDPQNLHTLELKSPVPIRTYRKTTPDYVIERIVQFKKQRPFLGKDKISVMLAREGIKVSSSTIGRIIKKEKLTYLWRTNNSACNYKKRIKKRVKKLRPPKNYSPKKPGSWIQIDTVKIQFMGSTVYVINGIDLYSRFVFSWAYTSPSSQSAKDFLNKLKLFFGGNFSIKMVQTDNGSEFMKNFQLGCDELEIEHTFSYPKTPKMNAYIESFNGTIQRECLEKTDATSTMATLNKKLMAYLMFYNFERPHTSLNHEVPAMLYLKSYFNNSTLPELHNKMWTHSRVRFSLSPPRNYSII